ncbi:hypothetical protein NDU88_003215 [Pleurodeles waltl]|uniref:Uncharacterized protein n=1 Tax=Pleurodeles waltl TaxID=8319 RepID=A0AAV7Q8U5_PLEWA|nr:hypothetical protein NDU88_003215 [Pleurodeles waltl]
MPSTEGKGDRRVGKPRGRGMGLFAMARTLGCRKTAERGRLRRREAAGDAGEEKRTCSIRTRPLECSRQQRCLEHARALNCLNSSRTSRKKPK